MSFHDKTKDLIFSVIDKEYENSCQHGKSYHSLHEGYSILREEVDEACSPVNRIENLMMGLWEEIKSENSHIMFSYVNEIEAKAFEGMMELAQVYACCMKLQNTLQGGENG